MRATIIYTNDLQCFNCHKVDSYIFTYFTIQYFEPVLDWDIIAYKEIQSPKLTNPGTSKPFQACFQFGKIFSAYYNKFQHD
ncbi:hypothetical protein TVAG_481630 [Trichomonas vaginalis G3]|uniref:Uncharacterized protein n=1 Tax=Trichomonas vaginalis (strain ATCC PRA-98 / G3) TaxID=412133 RepID=A2G2Y3_TRIV3|nr:alpha-tubulin binding [Trichomonas vaginalis G3]EAX88481.1 hypothetical protein TVAG_481630 [Trichomonas vaginalis G3]KAI5531109.1 alpha-tubulin binding [Trichomonas vaginalis G3]|eukprot:XP_001301411.1 hypothetical protein [Trichomonas vaginalis G3]